MDYIVKAYKDWKLHSQFQEIVPDEMDDTEFMFNEKQSIRESARSLKKYGSTRRGCNHMRMNETFVRHEVEKTDTLQGIALKYGCTTEQIRRANRLFASDSLFLRQYLLVPVERTSPYFSEVSPTDNSDVDLSNAISVTSESDAPTDANVSCHNSTNVRLAAALPTRPYSIAGDVLVQASDEDPALMNNHNATCSKQSKSLDSVATMTPEEENRKCINDFLNKIDNTISESRKYVERSKDMITSQSDVDLFGANDFVHIQRNDHLNNSYKSNNNRPQHHQRHSSTGSGNSDTAQLLNTTQMKRVQNSLKRLEKQQDDFFEL